MADYTLQVTWDTKDALAADSQLKAISATELGNEFTEIAARSADKYDSDDRGSANGIAPLDSGSLVPVVNLPAATATAKGVQELATTAEAITGSDPARIVTPAGIQAVLDQQAAFLERISQLTDPGADRLLAWDDSATGAEAAWVTISTGLSLTGTTLTADFTGTGHDAFSDFVSDEHVAHAGVSVIGTANNGLVAANDDLTVNIGLAINLSDITAEFTSGAAIGGPDLFLLDNNAGGTNTKIAYQDFGIPVAESGAFDTIDPTSGIDLSFANRFYKLSHADPITWTVPANSGTAFPVGTAFVLFQEDAGQVEVAITTDTLRAPNGAKTANQYSIIQVIKIAATEWVVTGDTTV